MPRGWTIPTVLLSMVAGICTVADLYNCRVLTYQSPIGTDEAAGQVWGQGRSLPAALVATAARRRWLNRPTSSSMARIICTSQIKQLTGWSNFQELANPPSDFNANVALGQPNPSTYNGANQGVGVVANGLYYPGGIALDASGDLFVSDSSNNRVVEYPAPLTNDENASVVLGQPDFSHNSANELTASSQYQPRQIAIDASVTPHRLYLADYSNNRVLGWRNATSFANDAPADLVIGQPDFNSSGCAAASATRFCNPTGVAVDASGHLYISDYSYSRVLEFSSPFASCGSFPCVYSGSANLAIGQDLNTGKNFTNTGCNHGGTVGPLTMCDPYQIAVDSVGNLYVADFGNNRVLEYNTPLAVTSVTGSGDAKADYVWGQRTETFATNACNKTARAAITLCEPTSVALDSSNNLYIGDYDNDRVLEFNEPTNATTAPNNFTANNVFGTGGSFTVEGPCSTGPGNICYAEGLAVDSSGDLFMADYGFNRVFEYFTPLTVTGVSGSGDTIADYVFGQGGVLSGATSCNFGASPDSETLCNPYGVTTDSSGDILIADSGNNRSLLFQGPFTVANNAIGKLPEQSDAIITLGVSPTALHFSKTRVGHGSAPQSVAVTNHNAFPVTLGAPNTPAGDFSIVNGCGSVIPAGVTCNLRVTFNPVTEGERGSRILIGDPSTGGPYLIDLSGSALKRKGRK